MIERNAGYFSSVSLGCRNMHCKDARSTSIVSTTQTPMLLGSIWVFVFRERSRRLARAQNSCEERMSGRALKYA